MGFKRRKIDTQQLKGYIGKKRVIDMRSSWETKIVQLLEQLYTIKEIQGYSSEELIVPYYSSLDDKSHRYFTDFLIKSKKGHNYIIEVKPFKDCLAPFKPRVFKDEKQKRGYDMQMFTYIRNTEKWGATIEACQKLTARTGQLWEFQVWTEKPKKYEKFTKLDDQKQGIIRRCIPV